MASLAPLMIPYSVVTSSLFRTSESVGVETEARYLRPLILLSDTRSGVWDVASNVNWEQKNKLDKDTEETLDTL